MSVSGSQQIRKRMIEDKLVRKHRGKLQKKHKKIKFKEKHKCDKSNFLTAPS